jgi:hypothetical protein
MSSSSIEARLIALALLTHTSIPPKRSTAPFDVPLHLGAKRFYRDRGCLK